MPDAQLAATERTDATVFGHSPQVQSAANGRQNEDRSDT